MWPARQIVPPLQEPQRQGYSHSPTAVQYQNSNFSNGLLYSGQYAEAPRPRLDSTQSYPPPYFGKGERSMMVHSGFRYPPPLPPSYHHSQQAIHDDYRASQAPPLLFINTILPASGTAGDLAQIKPKRRRIMPEQLDELVKLFEETDSPTFDSRETVGAATGMTNREVQVWFQNRRAKVNRLKARSVPMKETLSDGEDSGSPPTDGSQAFLDDSPAPDSLVEKGETESNLAQVSDKASEVKAVGEGSKAAGTSRFHITQNRRPASWANMPSSGELAHSFVGEQSFRGAVPSILKPGTGQRQRSFPNYIDLPERSWYMNSFGAVMQPRSPLSSDGAGSRQSSDATYSRHQLQNQPRQAELSSPPFATPGSSVSPVLSTRSTTSSYFSRDGRIETDTGTFYSPTTPFSPLDGPGGLGSPTGFVKLSLDSPNLEQSIPTISAPTSHSTGPTVSPNRESVTLPYQRGQMSPRRSQFDSLEKPGSKRNSGAFYIAHRRTPSSESNRSSVTPLGASTVPAHIEAINGESARPSMHRRAVSETHLIATSKLSSGLAHSTVPTGGRIESDVLYRTPNGSASVGSVKVDGRFGSLSSVAGTGRGSRLPPRLPPLRDLLDAVAMMEKEGLAVAPLSRQGGRSDVSSTTPLLHYSGSAATSASTASLPFSTVRAAPSATSNDFASDRTDEGPLRVSYLQPSVLPRSQTHSTLGIHQRLKRPHQTDVEDGMNTNSTGKRTGISQSPVIPCRESSLVKITGEESPVGAAPFEQFLTPSPSSLAHGTTSISVVQTVTTSSMRVSRNVAGDAMDIVEIGRGRREEMKDKALVGDEIMRDSDDVDDEDPIDAPLGGLGLLAVASERVGDRKQGDAGTNWELKAREKEHLKRYQESRRMSIVDTVVSSLPSSRRGSVRRESIGRTVAGAV